MNRKASLITTLVLSIFLINFNFILAETDETVSKYVTIDLAQYQNAVVFGTEGTSISDADFTADKYPSNQPIDKNPKAVYALNKTAFETEKTDGLVYAADGTPYDVNTNGGIMLGCNNIASIEIGVPENYYDNITFLLCNGLTMTQQVTAEVTYADKSITSYVYPTVSARSWSLNNISGYQSYHYINGNTDIKQDGTRLAWNEYYPTYSIPIPNKYLKVSKIKLSTTQRYNGLIILGVTGVLQTESEILENLINKLTAEEVTSTNYYTYLSAVKEIQSYIDKGTELSDDIIKTYKKAADKVNLYVSKYKTIDIKNYQNATVFAKEGVKIENFVPAQFPANAPPDKTDTAQFALNKTSFENARVNGLMYAANGIPYDVNAGGAVMLGCNDISMVNFDVPENYYKNISFLLANSLILNGEFGNMTATVKYTDGSVSTYKYPCLSGTGYTNGSLVGNESYYYLNGCAEITGDGAAKRSNLYYPTYAIPVNTKLKVCKISLSMNQRYSASVILGITGNILTVEDILSDADANIDSFTNEEIISIYLQFREAVQSGRVNWKDYPHIVSYIASNFENGISDKPLDGNIEMYMDVISNNASVSGKTDPDSVITLIAMNPNGDVNKISESMDELQYYTKFYADSSGSFNYKFDIKLDSVNDTGDYIIYLKYGDKNIFQAGSLYYADDNMLHEIVSNFVNAESENDLVEYLDVETYLKTLSLNYFSPLTKVDKKKLAGVLYKNIKKNSFAGTDKEKLSLLQKLIKESVIIDAYNEGLTDIVFSGDEFTYDYITEISKTDEAYNATLYSAYNTLISDSAKTGVREYLLNKSLVTKEDLRKAFMQGVMLNGITSPINLGYIHVVKILSSNNLSAVGLMVNGTVTAEAAKILSAGTEAYSSMDELKTAINEAIIEAKQKGEKNSGGGHSGSGRGSTAAATPLYSVDNNYTTQQTANQSFIDLDDCKWAEEAISYLKDKNIISGVTENEFRPNGQVTREEFVKVVCNMFGYEKESGNAVFKDVINGSWYEGYVFTGQKQGLINGISDMEFGVNTPISRADIAAVCYRALSKNQLSSSVQLKTFTDETYIPDYAVEAVRYLGGLGVISGYSDGSFKPDSYCTRAEMAMIAYRVLTIK